MNSTLKVRCFLTISSNGAVSVTKRKPAVGMDEISVGLNLEIPTALFEKPQLSATLIVPEDVAFPAEIPVEVIADMQQAMEQSSGMHVMLNVVTAEPQKQA